MKALEVIWFFWSIFKLPIFELQNFKKALRQIIAQLKMKLIEFILRKHKLKQLRNQLSQTTDVKQWLLIAQSIDLLDTSRQKWKQDDESANYDYKLIKAKTKLMARMREDKDIEGLMNILR